MSNNKTKIESFSAIDASWVKSIKKNPKATLKRFGLDVGDDVEINLVENTHDCVHFVIPDTSILNQDLSNISAAKLPPASTAGTVGSAGTFGSALSCVFCVGSISSAGSAATGG